MKTRNVKAVSRELYDAFSLINRDAKKAEKAYNCVYSVKVESKFEQLSQFTSSGEAVDSEIVTTGGFIAKQKAFSALKVMAELALKNAFLDAGG